MVLVMIRIAVCSVTAVLALCIGGSAEARAEIPWTFQGEHVAVVRAGSSGGFGPIVETRLAARIWFHPGVGWRVEIDSDSMLGQSRRIYGMDGSTFWEFDPAGNHYTMRPAGEAFADPRVLFAVMRASAGAVDADAVYANLLANPNTSVRSEDDDTVLGRPARVLVAEPYGCVLIFGPPGSSVMQQNRCGGYLRYWLDEETGWVLKAEADDGQGGDWTWDTVTAVFNEPVGPALFRFEPPEGAELVEMLD